MSVDPGYFTMTSDGVSLGNYLPYVDFAENGGDGSVEYGGRRVILWTVWLSPIGLCE